MYRPKMMIILLCFCFPLVLVTKAETNSRTGEKTETTSLKFVLTKLDITDKALELSYQINNDSKQDIWLCKDLGSAYRSFEVAATENGETLLVRRRLDVPITGSGEHVHGSYVRIPKASRWKETLLLTLPVRPHRIIMGRQPSDGVIKHVTRLLFEIGFYSGDFPGKILRLLEEAEKNLQKKHVDDMGYPNDVVGWLVSSVVINGANEGVPDRNEQFVIPWTDQTLNGEHVFRATVENLNVPYIEEMTNPEFRLEGLGLCRKVEITCRPSMLEYLFPYPIQQSLLNSDEKEYLLSQEKISYNDRTLINTLIREISRGENNWLQQSSYILTKYSSIAHITCYKGDEERTSLNIYDGRVILTEGKHCYQYCNELTSIQNIISHTKLVMPFRFRVECAANLRTLWHRLCLYDKAEKIRNGNSSNGNQVIYPEPGKWCDKMLQAFEIAGSKRYLLKVHKCPSVCEGKCHYAMNPNCKYDSPSDVVLLFETKAGWNQHGGPELFTFDNHDPKGGCVLLNDGTVKFIRTTEELKQLRWK